MPTTTAIAKEFSKSAPPEFQKIVSCIIKAIDRSPQKLDAAVKWRQLTFAINGDFHHWICAVAVTKKSVNLLFHYGSLLDDRDSILLSGESKFLRKIAYERSNQVDDRSILALVSQAIDKNQFFKENWKRIKAE